MMNYYGINKKIEVQRTDWVGPKARIEQKKADALLDEIVEHTIDATCTGGRMGPPYDRLVKDLFSKYTNLGFECTAQQGDYYSMSLTLKGTHRAMIEQFGEGYDGC